MKAMVYTEYGPPDVLKLKEVEKPAPQDDEILLKVYAASVNSWDWELLIGKTRGLGALRKPKYHILGCDVAGIIEAVGRNVKQYSLGDEVFGELCQSGRGGFPEFGGGGFAEYVCTHENTLTQKPASMTFAQAAAIPQAGVLAMQGLHHKGQIKPGQKVLFNGAGGGVGTFGVQIAKSYGAQVTGVDKPEKLDMLRSIGCDNVIDYTKEDFTKNKNAYDRIIDVVASHWSSQYKRSLRPGGRCIIIGGTASILYKSLLFGRFGNKKVGLMLYKPNKYLTLINELFNAGKVVPVIDKCYQLGETPEAFRYFGEGNHKGKLVIKVV